MRMLLYRSFVVGLLGAIALMIAVLPAKLERRDACPAIRQAAPAIVNVSRSALLATPSPPDAVIATIMGLAPGERIVAITGLDLDAPDLGLVADRFLEVTLSDGLTSRQVLVLVRS